MARTELPNGVILPAEYSDDWYDDMTSNLSKLDEVIGSDAEKLSEEDVGATALSNDYTDLDNKPALKPVATSGDYDDLDNKPDLNPYDQHLANTDIHVTAADKTKWNNGVSQAYVVRYASVAVSDNSTVPYTDLNNVDNIKANDLLLDTTGKLYQISAVDTANETVSVTTPLTQLAVDANVMHLSGNETASGIKTFSDDTYVKSLNFTNEVPSPSSSSSSIMPIIATITYGDSSPSVQARLNLRVTADGTKSLYPHENNQYALGLTSHKWSEVHATEYYYGSSDTEFSQKFVTTDTNQDISANKNFKGLITTVPNESLWPTDTNTSADITSLGGSTIHLEYKPSGKLTDLSGGAWSVVELGDGCFFFRINNGTDIRYKHFPSNSINRIPVVSGANRFINEVTPDRDNTYDLGSSSLRWRKINGLNPSSLGMPDLDSGVDISGYITNFGAGTVNEYTPLADGWISIANGSTDSPVFIRVYNDYGFEQVVYSERNEVGGTTGGTYTRFGALMIPCVKNVKIYIIVTPTSSVLASAKFYPCFGNV